MMWCKSERVFYEGLKFIFYQMSAIRQNTEDCKREVISYDKEKTSADCLSNMW